MLNPFGAQQLVEERIREAHAFVARERQAQELVAGRTPQAAGWKRRLGRWLIRLGQRWAPMDQAPDASSNSSTACCPPSASC